MTRARFDIHLDSTVTDVVHAAECVIEEEAGLVRRVDFRYTPDYVENPNAFALDPKRLPLGPGETPFACAGGVPGFIDDYLPDAWGRRVLTALAWHRDGKRLNLNSAIDLLALIPPGSRIGALSFTPVGRAPRFEPGVPFAALAEAERAAVHVDALDWESVDAGEFGLVHLAEAGSSVGGARPKVLVTDGDTHYLAKFNRLSGDAYNNACVELACLEMARSAGLDVARGRAVAGVNGRDVLLLERFDIAADGHRNHLVTINALLKEESSQRDSGLPFRYDDVAELLSRYSAAIKTDLEQLARLALFNRATNNTDDHARNFSLIHRGDGYRLSPAYDLVPNLAVGEYHAAGFGYGPRPPRPSEVPGLGKVLGLSKPWMRACAEEILNALDGWPRFAEQAGLDESESQRIADRFNP
ncbi:MAG: type II toxin-antitoxin system HipA family toxin [Gammaproteobacteria bacterium]|nr:type II toxin-antitoxin system HipA family toxin [Gammaproteobacteria bacterium]